jgi:hypothetical protein
VFAVWVVRRNAIKVAQVRLPPVLSAAEKFQPPSGLGSDKIGNFRVIDGRRGEWTLLCRTVTYFEQQDTWKESWKKTLCYWVEDYTGCSQTKEFYESKQSEEFQCN